MITDHAIKLEFDFATHTLAQRFNLNADRLQQQYGSTRRDQERLISLFHDDLRNQDQFKYKKARSDYWFAPIVITSAMFGFLSYAVYPPAALLILAAVGANRAYPHLARQEFDRRNAQLGQTLAADLGVPNAPA